MTRSPFARVEPVPVSAPTVAGEARVCVEYDCTTCMPEESLTWKHYFHLGSRSYAPLECHCRRCGCLILPVKVGRAEVRRG